MSRMYLSAPHMEGRERELLLEAFDSNWIAPLGPHVDAFERELAQRGGRKHCAALASGTAGLHLALQLLGVGPGDPVLVSDLTFVASVNPIRYVGATPILIDSEPRTWNLDPELVAETLARLERAGTPAKAVIAVDLLGQCADYDALLPVCERHGVPLIEDAAEALGSTFQGRPAGSFGRLAVFSFNGNKIITSGGGGALLADDPALVTQARKLATQARDPAPHYQHSETGYNYRLSNILAAIGRGQLETLDRKVDARRATRASYAEAFEAVPGIELMPLDPRGRSNCWLTCVTIDPDAFGADREAVRLHLETLDIESRPLWKPMHLQPLYEECEFVGPGLSARLFDRGLCLPSGSVMTAGDRERVAAAVLAAAGRST